MKKQILFSLFLLLCAFLNAQVSSVYDVTQKDLPKVNARTRILKYFQNSSHYDSLAVYKTFYTGSGEVFVADSAEVKGYPLGFDFRIGNKVFDKIAINLKGYVVFGEKGVEPFVVYADTLSETLTDTVFTHRNQNLVSGLYLGKEFDRMKSVSLFIQSRGFPGEQFLRASLYFKKVVNGKRVYYNQIITIKDKGNVEVLYIMEDDENAPFSTYGAFVQCIDGKSSYVTGRGNHRDAWDAVSVYEDDKSHFSVVSDTVRPFSRSTSINPRYEYGVELNSKVSRYGLPKLFDWNPKTFGMEDSAYFYNDHTLLRNGDTIPTSKDFYWAVPLEDSLLFDVWLGVDTATMELISQNIEAETKYNVSLGGLASVTLDTLASGQEYYIRILKKDRQGGLLGEKQYKFYTEEGEEQNAYCEQQKSLYSGSIPHIYSLIDFNTLHYEYAESKEIISFDYSLIPDTLTWSTELKTGESYWFKMKVFEASTNASIHTYPSIYIDFNQNGVFETVSQTSWFDREHYSTQSNSLFEYDSILIKVPEEALSGKTRMRIFHKQSNNRFKPSDPCGFSLGYYMDFTLTILPADTCVSLGYTEKVIPPSCYGDDGEMEIAVNGGTTPYRIRWNTGVASDTLNVLQGIKAPARYRATIEDAAGCKLRTRTLQLTQPLPIYLDTNTVQDTKELSLSGGVEPYGLEFNSESVLSSLLSSDTVQLEQYLDGDGVYVFQVTDAQACVFSVSQTITGGFREASVSEQIKVYPNPFSTDFNVEGMGEVKSVRVTTVSGNHLFFDSLEQTKEYLVSASKGLYVLKLEDFLGKVNVIKMLKQ